MNYKVTDISTDNLLIGKYKKIKHGSMEIEIDQIAKQIKFNSLTNQDDSVFICTETGDSNINL